jgi:hypothetical protein
MNPATSADGPNRHSGRISPGADQQLPRPLASAAHRFDGVEDHDRCDLALLLAPTRI